MYKELRQLIFKTTGVVGQLRDAIKKVAGVQEAILYGSFAQDQQDASSDIDVLIIGEPHAEGLEEAIRKLERRLGREISYTSLSSKELKERRSRKDPLIEDIFRKKHIKLLAQ
ncbi:MAG: nucleotidyltransferase domain-containing protein [Acidobacteria bacterium]|nr:nucleotidyltransferase domain-containing protein [Acidobacteriota bacterium]